MKLDNPAPPNLPLAPSTYDQTYFESLTNTLRLYFNRIENVTRNLLGPEGGVYLNLPYGAFYDTTEQTAASTTTAYAITLNSTTLSNGVTVESNSQITFEYEGVYNIQFSIQLVNDTNQPQDIDIWFRKNGVDIPDSNSRFGLSAHKNPGDPYHVIGSLNYVDSFLENDYVQLYWKTSNTSAYIETYTAPSSPTRPAIPSVILTATFVSAN